MIALNGGAILAVVQDRTNQNPIKCSTCHGTGIITRPYIAGVASSMSACDCEVGREWAEGMRKQMEGET